jgi:hypothetical protein
MAAVVGETVGNVTFVYFCNPVAPAPERAAAADERELEAKPAGRKARWRRVSATAAERTVACREDDALIERVVMGDLVAADRLRERHQRHLTAMAVKVLGDEEEAAAAVEAAFEEAYIGWPPERGQVKAWLKRLVRRRAWARRRLLHGRD